MEYQFYITPDTTSGNTIRSDHTVPVSPDNRIGVLAFGRKAYGNEKWGDGTTALWLHVLEYEELDGERKPINGWIASIHKSKKVASIVSITGAPPPFPGEKAVAVTIELEGYETLTLAGTVKPK
jgi:hypothetical protein